MTGKKQRRISLKQFKETQEKITNEEIDVDVDVIKALRRLAKDLEIPVKELALNLHVQEFFEFEDIEYSTQIESIEIKGEE